MARMKKSTVAVIAGAAALAAAIAVPAVANAAGSHHGKPPVSESGAGNTSTDAPSSTNADKPGKSGHHRFDGPRDGQGRPDRPAPFADLGLTEAQADAVHTALEANMEKHRPAGDGHMTPPKDGNTPSVDGTRPTPPTVEEMTTELQSVLAPLVTDGTITQEQADSIVKEMVSHRGEHGPGGPGRHHGRGSHDTPPPSGDTPGADSVNPDPSISTGQ